MTDKLFSFNLVYNCNALYCTHSLQVFILLQNCHVLSLKITADNKTKVGELRDSLGEMG